MTRTNVFGYGICALNRRALYGAVALAVCVGAPGCARSVRPGDPIVYDVFTRVDTSVRVPDVPVVPPPDVRQGPRDGSLPIEDGGRVRELAYVLTDVGASPVPLDPTQPQEGFNLDGIFSGGSALLPRACGKLDNPSALDPDQNCPADSLLVAGGCRSPSCAPAAGCVGGVDNQLPVLLDALDSELAAEFPEGLRAALARNFEPSRNSLLVRITDVDNLDRDDDVTVSVYEAFAEFAAGCDSNSAGRAYRVAARSVLGVSLDTPVLPRLPARIVAGRLMTVSAAPEARLRLPLLRGSSAEVVLMLTHAQLRMDLGVDLASNGNLGGVVPATAMVEQIAQSFPRISADFSRAIGGFVDVEQPVPPAGTAGVCDDRTSVPPRLGNLAVALRFRAVRAVIVPGLAMARTPGTCGS
ncbi:MAG: hypothetical protein Q8Q09_01900 [Deltaproteobacteria bacterium]|nr:hypothetical protein [Deltaproteobacteria bacterium]